MGKPRALLTIAKLQLRESARTLACASEMRGKRCSKTTGAGKEHSRTNASKTNPPPLYSGEGLGEGALILQLVETLNRGYEQPSPSPSLTGRGIMLLGVRQRQQHVTGHQIRIIL
jgi:hypothetical protein